MADYRNYGQEAAEEKRRAEAKQKRIDDLTNKFAENGLFTEPQARLLAEIIVEEIKRRKYLYNF